MPDLGDDLPEACERALRRVGMGVLGRALEGQERGGGSHAGTAR